MQKIASLPLLPKVLLAFVIGLFLLMILLFAVNEFFNHKHPDAVTDVVRWVWFDKFVQCWASPIYYFYDRPASH